MIRSSSKHHCLPTSDLLRRCLTRTPMVAPVRKKNCLTLHHACALYIPDDCLASALVRVLEPNVRDSMQHLFCDDFADLKNRCPRILKLCTKRCLRFPFKQVKLLLQIYQAPRHVELEGVVCDALKALRGIIPGCDFATTLLQLLVVGPLREVLQAHPTVSFRVFVDDLSLQRFGSHDRVAHELELVSTCLASKLAQAGCEIATKQSKGPQQLNFRAYEAAAAFAPPRSANGPSGA